MRSVENSPSRQRSSPQTKNQWRDDCLAGGQRAMQVRDPEQRDDFIRDLKTKIGDQTMMHRIAREENQSTGRRPAFSTAQAIARIRSVCNDVTLRFETFRHQARLHRVEYLAIDDSSTQGARVARGNAEEEARTHDILSQCTVVRRDQDCAAHLGAFSAQAGSWRENNLLAPTRRRASPGPRTHDGTIATQQPDEMWAIDGTACMTDQGSATVFGVIDHCTGECLGAHAARRGTRHEAIDTLRQAIRATRGSFDRDVAAGVALRHDHGSQFISHAVQDELRFKTLRIDPTITRSSGVLATRRPRSTDAVSSWRLRDLHTNLCQQWDRVHVGFRVARTS